MTAPLRERHIATSALTFAPARAASPAPRLAPRVAPLVEPPRPRRVPQAPPKLRVVDPAADRRRRLDRAVTAALVVAICAGLFSIVALRVVLAQGQVAVDRLETTVDAQRAAQQQLGLTVAELEAPAQIVSAARSRLGMVNPGAVIYLRPPPAPTR